MKLKTANLLWLALIIAAGCFPLEARAYCNEAPSYYSISHEFRRAEYVVKARVIQETWLGEDAKEKPLKPPFQFGNPRPWGFDPYIGAYYDIEVLTAFKGHPGSRLRLFSENTEARFWLEVGSEYIFFVTEEKFDQPIDLRPTIDTCGNSALVKKGQATLRAIEKLSHEMSASTAADMNRSKHGQITN